MKGYKSEDLAVLRGVRDKFVNTSAPPASTLLGVATLFQDDYLIEVDAIAVVPARDAPMKKAGSIPLESANCVVISARAESAILSVSL